MFKLILFTFAFFIFTACGGGGKVYNVPSANTQNKYTMKQMETAIVVAGEQYKWNFKKIKEGKLTGEYNRGKLMAKIAIRYSSTKYSINYLDSKNFKYNGTTIHKNYNALVKKIEKAINHNLQNISNGKQVKPTGYNTKNETTTKNIPQAVDTKSNAKMRLKELSELYKEGLITKKEYDKKREVIISEL